MQSAGSAFELSVCPTVSGSSPVKTVIGVVARVAAHVGEQNLRMSAPETKGAVAFDLVPSATVRRVHDARCARAVPSHELDA